MAKPKVSDPVAAARKAARAKEAKRNREERAKVREAVVLRKDHRSLENEIRTLERKGPNRNAQDDEDLEALRAEVARIKQIKEEYVAKHPEHRRLVVGYEKDEEELEEERRAATGPAAPGMGMGMGGVRGRDPRFSVYYDPVFNPYGAPPPGMPYIEKPYEQLLSEGLIEPPQIHSQAPALPSEAPPTITPDQYVKEDEDEDEDNDGQSDDDDSEDDGIVLPEGPPPLPPGPPPGELIQDGGDGDNQDSGDDDDDDDDDDDGIVMPSGPPPLPPSSTLPPPIPTGPKIPASLPVQPPLPTAPAPLGLQPPPPLGPPPSSFPPPPPGGYSGPPPPMPPQQSGWGRGRGRGAPPFGPPGQGRGGYRGRPPAAPMHRGAPQQYIDPMTGDAVDTFQSHRHQQHYARPLPSDRPGFPQAPRPLPPQQQYDPHHQQQQQQQQHHDSVPNAGPGPGARPRPPPPSAPPRPPPGVILSAAPQLRDLKKEATAFVPAAIRKKQAMEKQRVKMGLPGRIDAAPSRDPDGVGATASGAGRGEGGGAGLESLPGTYEKPDLLKALRPHLDAGARSAGQGQGQASAGGGTKDGDTSEYGRFLEEVGELL